MIYTKNSMKFKEAELIFPYVFHYEITGGKKIYNDYLEENIANFKRMLLLNSMSAFIETASINYHYKYYHDVKKRYDYNNYEDRSIYVVMRFLTESDAAFVILNNDNIKDGFPDSTTVPELYNNERQELTWIERQGYYKNASEY